MFLNGTDPGLRQIRTPTVDTFTAGVGFTAGSSTTVTLTADPGSENSLIVTFDGITQHRDTYSVSGTTVTFDTAISTGVSKIEATYTTTIPAATPGDGTVTQAKLGDEAINEAKLQVSNAPTNGYLLTAQSGATGGLTWEEAGSGGKVLQVVQGELTTTATTTSSTYSQTGITANITPSATSSKVLVHFNLAYHGDNSYYSKWDLRRDGSTIFPNPTSIGSRTASLGGMMAMSDTGLLRNLAGEYLDSPSSTSALTYEIYFGRSDGSNTTYLNRSKSDTDAAHIGRASSIIILQEIGA